MKAKLLRLAAAGATVVAVVVLGSIVFGQVAQADPDITEGGLDANPCSDGSGVGGPCLGANPTFYNGPTTLGQIEDLVTVCGSGPLDGSTDIWVDAYVKGNVPALTAGEPRLVYDSTKVAVCDSDDGTVGADEQTLKFGAGAIPVWATAPPCDTDGIFDPCAINFDGGAGPPGDGMAMRFGLDIDFTGSYVTPFTWQKFAFKDSAATQLDPTTIYGGELAVNGPGCPVGGIAELPDVSDSAGRNYVALAGLAAGALVALSAGAWYARRRWLG